jgi:hypothetical protein
LEALERGLETAAGAALWALGTWALVFVAELLWTLHLRRLLARADVPRPGTTIVFVAVLVVVMPLVAGYAGCVAAAQRRGADAMARVRAPVVEEIVDRAADRAALVLLGADYDDTLAIDLAALQARALQARTGSAGRFEALVFEVVATATPTATPVTWRGLVAHARIEFANRVRAQLRQTAAGLRSSARFTLLVTLAIALAINGLAYALVRQTSGAGSASR